MASVFGRITWSCNARPCLSMPGRVSPTRPNRSAIPFASNPHRSHSETSMPVHLFVKPALPLGLQVLCGACPEKSIRACTYVIENCDVSLISARRIFTRHAACDSTGTATDAVLAADTPSMVHIIASTERDIVRMPMRCVSIACQ